MGENSSGYAQAGSRNVSRVMPEKVAERAIKKAIDGKNPIELEPGLYEVILEPLASSELLDFLGYLGFNAKTYQEGRSFMCEMMGKKVMGDNITILDDAYNEQGFAFPFDFEGVPKQKVQLIEKGIAKGLVYDSLTAGKENKESTGHALPAPNTFGPIPTNMVLLSGNSSLDKMIRNAKKAILVTRFHYTNTVEPKKTIFTGMTRDGTFLIENGAITKPIKNLRFTESIINALNKVLETSQDLTLVGGGAGYEGRFATGTLVPALRIESFNFSGKTEF
jgi:predicted Zn-dependent protease